nr:uncharacterized protein LOC117835068 isoform X2 [Setaria viridis]
MASPKFEILGCIAKILESKAHAKYKGWLHPASKRKEGGAGDPSHCRWGLPVRRRQRQVSAAGQGRRTTDQSCGCFIRATSHPRQGRGVAAFLSYRVIEPPLHGCCSVCVPLGVKRAATFRSKSSPFLDGCCSAGDKVPDCQKRLEVNQEQGTAIEATLCTRINQLIHPSTAISRVRRCCVAEVVARINNASPSAASDARAEQVLPLLLVAVAADTAEAAASCGDQEEANLAGGGAARLPITRRAHAASLLLGLVGVDVAVAAPAPARADDESGGGEEGVLGAIKSIFDPNEKTKAGKVLPKAYLKAAREVVRTLRESLEEDDGGDMAKFRRNADAAKESIREFLGGWRGQQAVAAEESYVALEKAIRSLAEFYSKAGPSAPLPQDVKNKILDDLSTADAYL